MPLLNFGKNKKTAPKTYGRVIVIDGIDGSGKATQTQLLANELKLNGFSVEIADFPQYGTKSAALVEDYLINRKYGQVNPYAASVFYAVDRFDASFKIRQWLEEGKIVISNRYVTANAGHQGGKIEDDQERLKFFRWLNDLEYRVFNIPKPSLNIILHMPAMFAYNLAQKKWKEQRQYMNGKTTDMHEEDLNHLEQAEKIFQEISKLFPNTKLVECVEEGVLMTPEQIHNKVWELVRRIALKDFKV